MSLAARLFLDLGGVEQRRDDRCRPDADGNARLHQLGPALLIIAVEIAIIVAHRMFSMAFGPHWEAT